MTYVALITGASSGIGEATARRLAADPDVELYLVARRAERLHELASELGATAIVADLNDPGSHVRIAEQIEQERGALNLLVNNAGARWSADFANGGWANVERHMRINFEAPVRLCEALLPLLRRTAAASGPLATGAAIAGRQLVKPVAIVNVSSTSGRLGRRGAGAYSASKSALNAWTDSLFLEEAAHGVHVGLVEPGFIRTEGFPQAELRAKPLTRPMVSDRGVVVDAILAAGPGGRAEVYAPRYYRLFAAARILLPRVLRRAANRGTFTTTTHSE